MARATDEPLATCEVPAATVSEAVPAMEAIREHWTRGLSGTSGTIRYETLKAARFRCELCGISADQRALQVDHIMPRNSGARMTVAGRFHYIDGKCAVSAADVLLPSSASERPIGREPMPSIFSSTASISANCF
jgi:hypothetical protein